MPYQPACWPAAAADPYRPHARDSSAVPRAAGLPTGLRLRQGARHGTNPCRDVCLLRRGGRRLAGDLHVLVGGELIRDQLKRAPTGIRHDRELLKILVQDNAQEPPAEAALLDRLEERRLLRARERLAATEAAAKAAREDAIWVVGEAEAESITKEAAAEPEAKRLTAATEGKRLIEEAKLRRKTLEDELARRKLAEEAATLRRRTEDPAVQRRYTVLLDKVSGD